MEQKNLEPYRCLLNSDQMIRVYLDELAPADPERLELGILHMIAAEPDDALRNARQLVPRARAAKLPAEFRARVIQFIETVILYQFPTMTREEIERMLQVTDVRQTRVFQEALQEGREEGRDEGREEGREEGRQEGRGQAILDVATRLLHLGRPIAEVVEATGLTAAKVRALKKRL
jgi:predicted transposase/invertase (TIGR01784 family)